MAKKKGSRSEKPTTLYRQPTGDREDNPSRRFSELSEDREFSSEEFVNTARARHDAMACSRTMAPVVETALTPATPGLNNWVELGPTGIPNGQTYGSSRVIVTGRVTEIRPASDEFAHSLRCCGAWRHLEIHRRRRNVGT